MKVLLINGSPHEKGCTYTALSLIAGELKAQGIRLVPIIDAGVRIDPENPVCAEGLANGSFCTKADGTPFVAAVWPGKAYFADFLRPEVREWFGRQYKALTDCGIEGFWNFSHYDLSVSYPNVVVENVHLGDSLMSLGYRLRNQE